jgi:hypothetical protein
LRAILELSAAERALSEVHTSCPAEGVRIEPGWSSAVLARKPLIGTVAANVLEHGTGALNIDGCRVGTDGGTSKGSKPEGAGNGIYGAGIHGACEIIALNAGRWPANLIHDGSEEVVGLFPETESGGGDKRGGCQFFMNGDSRSEPTGHKPDSGSAARFFYTSKADADDRLGSKHPTVKPVDLMQWLVRLVTPRGGVCLDPFAGTGTTGEAAWREGCRAILIEREEEYQADIARRMELAQQPTKRAAVAKTKNALTNPNDLPLFAMPEAAG